MPFSFFFPYVFSHLCTVLTVPISVCIARRYGVVDRPDGARRRHAAATPRLGGISFALPFCLALPFVGRSATLGALSVFGLFVTACGVFDDVVSLSPAKKLLLQILTALGSALAGIRILPLPLFPSLVASTFFLVLMMNAQNLVDGLDGLCATLTLVSATGLLCYSLSRSESEITAALLLFIAAVSGFLPYNARRAVTFMGDGGSQFLGYTLGGVSILLLNAASNASLPVAATPDDALSPSPLRVATKLLFCLALPLCDLAFSATRRVLHGRSPFAADRGHLHHRLVDAGFSTGVAVMLLAASAASLAIFANAI